MNADGSCYYNAPTKVGNNNVASWGSADGLERITLKANGGATFAGGLIVDDLIQTKGVYVGLPINNLRFLSAASVGSGNSPLYIGNGQINVSSDRRIKDNIKDTELDALEAIQKIKVKDFTWNDPTDLSFNNKNARGVWTGVIAQELVEVLPFVVNAPRKEEDLSIDYEDEGTWTLDQSQLCPVLIKALQQTLTRIEALEAEVQSLKGTSTADV